MLSRFPDPLIRHVYIVLLDCMCVYLCSVRSYHGLKPLGGIVGWIVLILCDAIV